MEMGLDPRRDPRPFHKIVWVAHWTRAPLKRRLSHHRHYRCFCLLGSSSKGLEERLPFSKFHKCSNKRDSPLEMGKGQGSQYLLYIYIHTCTHTCRYMHTHTYIKHICIHTDTHYTCTHTHEHTHACVSVQTYIIYTCTPTHTHMCK